MTISRVNEVARPSCSECMKLRAWVYSKYMYNNALDKKKKKISRNIARNRKSYARGGWLHTRRQGLTKTKKKNHWKKRKGNKKKMPTTTTKVRACKCLENNAAVQQPPHPLMRTFSTCVCVCLYIIVCLGSSGIYECILVINERDMFFFLFSSRVPDAHIVYLTLGCLVCVEPLTRCALRY